MKMRLTDLAVKKLTPPTVGQVTYWDAANPGFGIRCSSRRKSYVVMYGEGRKLKTLGRYPDIPLADARKQAKQFLANLTTSDGLKQEIDFNDVVEEYISDCRRRLRASTLSGYEHYLKHIRFVGPISKIGLAEVMLLITRHTSSKSSQNYAFITFKVLFNWAVRRQYLGVNPLGTMGRPNRPSSRERTLSDEEVRVLLTYTLENRNRFNDIVTLLTLTGQRRSEISKLRWTEIDNDLLLLPSS